MSRSATQKARVARKKAIKASKEARGIGTRGRKPAGNKSTPAARELTNRFNREKTALTRRVEELRKEKDRLDRQLEKTQQMADLAAASLSPKDRISAVMEAFRENDIHPILELAKLAKQTGKGALPIRERVAVLKFLAQYEAPTPKSMDISGSVDHSVTIQAVQFGGQKELKQAHAAPPAIPDEEYDEFEASTQEETPVEV